MSYKDVVIEGLHNKQYIFDGPELKIRFAFKGQSIEINLRTPHERHFKVGEEKYWLHVKYRKNKIPKFNIVNESNGKYKKLKYAVLKGGWSFLKDVRYGINPSSI